VKPIRSLARAGYKTFTDGDWIESPFIRDEGLRLIQTGNVGIGEYKEQGFRYIDEDTFHAFRCTEILPGDVLICRLADPVGRACLAPDLGCRMITSVDVCILKPAPDVHAAFLVYALTGSQYLAWLGGICRGGTRDRVSRSMLGAIRVQKPPLPEQRAIATFLYRETARIDALIAKVRDAIERLKELRTALISAAVTGKIDVREEAA
jgi:type I restriction enzyme S subunit